MKVRRRGWDLLILVGFASRASRDRLAFTRDINEALSKAEFCPGKRPGTAPLECLGIRPDGRPVY